MCRRSSDTGIVLACLDARRQQASRNTVGRQRETKERVVAGIGAYEIRLLAGLRCRKRVARRIEQDRRTTCRGEKFELRGRRAAAWRLEVKRGTHSRRASRAGVALNGFTVGCKRRADLT